MRLNKKTSIVILLSGLLTGLYAAAIPKNTFISGRINNENRLIPDTIEMAYLPLDENAATKWKSFKVITNAAGEFKATIPLDTKMGRLFVFDNSLQTALLSPFSDPLLIAQGDDFKFSINMVSIRPGVWTTNWQASGPGASKYNCLQEVNAVSVPEPDDLSERLSAIETALRHKLAIVDSYKSRLSPSTCQLIKTDAAGKLLDLELNWGLNDVPYKKNITSEELKEKVALFHRLKDELLKYNTGNSNVMAVSENYMEALLHFAKIELAMEQPDREVGLALLYEKLKKDYSGLVREKLFLMCFSDYGRANVPRQDYLHCLKDALTIMKAPVLRDSVNDLFRQVNEGYAYNFNLPLDSSGRKLKLSDLKGKVILMDFSCGYYCTACYEFANAFHQKVYPLFKDNPDFKVVCAVPVPDGPKRQEIFMHYLRGEGVNGGKPLHFNTDKDYINLFAGTKDAKIISDYYHQHSAPLLVLIDKKGKIIASTGTSFPFFTEPESPMTEKLADLIKEALAQTD